MTRPLFEPNPRREIAGNSWQNQQLARRYYPGKWLYVGDGGDNEPDFLNGWANAGAGLRRLRFRDSGFEKTEIHGVVTGGTPPSVVCVIPAIMPLPDESEPIAGTAGASGSSSWQLDPDGSLWVLVSD